MNKVNCYFALRNKNFGFTLAEVLITIGIIGVVAALTIPVLIQNYKKHVVETRLQKFYSEINQALYRSWIDNGQITNLENAYNIPTYNNNLNWVNTNIEPYMEIISKKANGYKIEVTFKNGSKILVDGVGYDGILFYPVSKPKTDIKGKDCFAFQFANSQGYYTAGKMIMPFLGNYTRYPKKNTMFTDSTWGCKPNISCSERNLSDMCTAVIMQNGWKIPDDYPIRF